MFVRGHYADTNSCHRDYELNQKSSGTIDVKFDACGMRRQRNVGIELDCK